MSTRVFDALDAVVSTLKAAGLTVWDGPVVTGSYGDAVYIGFDADPESNFEAATIEQDWSGLGARKRNETIELLGGAVVLYGDADSWSAARARVKALIAGVETALRADPSLAQPPPFVASFKRGVLYQEPVPEVGFQVRFTFTLTVELARV